MIEYPYENWTKFPNHILDSLPFYTSTEVKILCLIVRETLGRGRENSCLSIRAIEKGTGINKRTVYPAIEKLHTKGALERVENKRSGNSYRVIWKKPCVEEISPPCVEEISPPVGKSLPQAPFKDSFKEKTPQADLLRNCSDTLCKEIFEISLKKKIKFNPWQYCQFHRKKYTHEGAIGESLKAILKSLNNKDFKEPWAYGVAVLKTVNGNWNEKDSIHSGDIEISPNLKSVIAGIG